MTTTIQALDQLVVVNLDIHIWTARKKLVPLDLGEPNFCRKILRHWAVSVSATRKICARSAP